MEAAEQLQMYADIYIGLVTARKTSNWFKTEKHIDRTPSLYLLDQENIGRSINLDEFYGDKLNIKDWILQVELIVCDWFLMKVKPLSRPTVLMIDPHYLINSLFYFHFYFHLHVPLLFHLCRLQYLPWPNLPSPISHCMRNWIYRCWWCFWIYSTRMLPPPQGE